MNYEDAFYNWQQTRGEAESSDGLQEYKVKGLRLSHTLDRKRQPRVALTPLSVLRVVIGDPRLRLGFHKFKQEWAVNYPVFLWLQ